MKVISLILSWRCKVETGWILKSAGLGIEIQEFSLAWNKLFCFPQALESVLVTRGLLRGSNMMTTKVLKFECWVLDDGTLVFRRMCESH